MSATALQIVAELFGTTTDTVRYFIGGIFFCIGGSIVPTIIVLSILNPVAPDPDDDNFPL